MSKVLKASANERRVQAAAVALPILLCAFASGATASGTEKNIALPVSAYEKLLSRMEQLEGELKTLKSRQANQAKKPKKLEEQTSSPQVVVVERSNDGSSPSGAGPVYIPTQHRGSIHAPTGGYGAVDNPTSSNLGAYYGKAGVTALKLFGTHSNALTLIGNIGVATDDAHQSVSFDHGFDAGGRYEAGYQAKNGFGWAVRYWHYKTKGDASASATAGAGTTDIDVHANLSDEPGIDLEADNVGERIDADRELSFRTLDVEASLAQTNDSGFQMVFTGGVRFSRIDMKAEWQQINVDGVSVDEAIDMQNEFRGAGPVIGLNVTAPIFRGGALQINAFGLARASLLYGQGDHTTKLIDDAGDLDVYLNKSRDGVVATGELQLGLEAMWKLSQDRPLELFARGVLEAQYWGGVGTVAVHEGDHDGYEASFVFDANQGMYGGTFMVGVRTPIGK